MTLLFAAVIGVLLGGVGAWFAASSKSKALLDEVRANASALQAEADAKDRENDSLQQELRKESEERVKAQTEYNDTKARFNEARIKNDAETTAKEIENASLQQQLRKEAEERVRAQTELAELKLRLEEAKAQIEQDRKFYQDTEKSLANSFDALADKALKSNNQAFIDLAKGTFETIQTQAKGDLELRQKAIEGVVAPLKDTLGRYEKQILDIETSRQKAYGSLHDQITKLQGVTGNLNVALRNPQVRGRWGEMTLRRVAELAGMSEHCDFTEQETFNSLGGKLRPDMIVKLPGGRQIAVDSKAPLQAYLDALAAPTEEERIVLLKQHSAHVKSHMNQLAAKNYWEQLDQATDFVILFLPGESFYSAAIEKDPELMEYGMERRVILAAPSNLISLLRAVAFGWRQEQATRNAEQISELGKELFDRIRKFVDHFEGMGTSLRRAVDSYNQAVGSFERRVMVQARKFQELGAASSDEVAELKTIEQVPRSMTLPERNDTE